MSRQEYAAQLEQRIEVDAKRVNEMLSQLNDKETKKAIKSALRKSASIIRKQAQTNWMSACPDGERLGKEINIAVYRNASGARVDLLDKRRPGSKQFVLKFFDLGTEERVTKKKANRGSISASHFFKNAVETQRGNAEKSLEEYIIQSIKKVANKKR